MQGIEIVFIGSYALMWAAAKAAEHCYSMAIGSAVARLSRLVKGHIPILLRRSTFERLSAHQAENDELRHALSIAERSMSELTQQRDALAKRATMEAGKWVN